MLSALEMYYHMTGGRDRRFQRTDTLYDVQDGTPVDSSQLTGRLLGATEDSACESSRVITTVADVFDPVTNCFVHQRAPTPPYAVRPDERFEELDIDVTRQIGSIPPTQSPHQANKSSPPRSPVASNPRSSNGGADQQVRSEGLLPPDGGVNANNCCFGEPFPSGMDSASTHAPSPVAPEADDLPCSKQHGRTAEHTESVKHDTISRAATLNNAMEVDDSSVAIRNRSKIASSLKRSATGARNKRKAPPCCENSPSDPAPCGNGSRSGDASLTRVVRFSKRLRSSATASTQVRSKEVLERIPAAKTTQGLQRSNAVLHLDRLVYLPQEQSGPVANKLSSCHASAGVEERKASKQTLPSRTRGRLPRSPCRRSARIRNRLQAGSGA